MTVERVWHSVDVVPAVHLRTGPWSVRCCSAAWRDWDTTEHPEAVTCQACRRTQPSGRWRVPRDDIDEWIRGAS